MAYGNIGTYGVSDYSSIGVSSIVGVRGGISDGFQLVLAASRGVVTSTGLDPTVRAPLVPNSGGLILTGVAPTILVSVSPSSGTLALTGVAPVVS